MKYHVEGVFAGRPASGYAVYADSAAVARNIAESAGITVSVVLPEGEEAPPSHGQTPVSEPQGRVLERVVTGIGAFVIGGMAGAGLLLAVTVGLWATRAVWFERPTGGNLQYFDLMFLLGLGAAFMALPSIIGGGLIYAWWATRNQFNSGVPPVSCPAHTSSCSVSGEASTAVPPLHRSSDSATAG